MEECDVAIVGAGIVGLATAYALSQREPGLRLMVVEKEARVAFHQTGRNSGVIHSGIYYKPGSLKARLCVDGARRMVEFCARHGVRVDPVGKVIVATTDAEIPRLEELARRGVANGVRVREIDARRLREIEPEAAGLCALHSPDTGIVDYKAVSVALRRLLEAAGARVRLVTRLERIESGGRALRLTTDRGTIRAARLINCAGLHCDAVARLAGLEPDLRIVPFRGEYYFLNPRRAGLVRGLIYPVPDPNLPFLGVHFTRTVHGEVEAGPNAVLAFAREGYSLGDVNVDELAETLTFGGFWKMAARFWRTGVYEIYRSMSKAAFVRALQRLVPAVRDEDLDRGGAGVRAQAVDASGALVQDFRFLTAPLSLHVLNAPSPAATASLAIGEYIADEARAMFDPPGSTPAAPDAGRRAAERPAGFSGISTVNGSRTVTQGMTKNP